MTKLRASNRYHVHALRYPREVRHALAYVLLNAKKHGKKLRGYSLIPKGAVDPCSSGQWFDGWASKPRVFVALTSACPNEVQRDASRERVSLRVDRVQDLTLVRERKVVFRVERRARTARVVVAARVLS